MLRIYNIYIQIYNKLCSLNNIVLQENLLYLAFTFFTGNETSSFENFSSGLLVGLSIGCNLVGIIL